MQDAAAYKRPLYSLLMWAAMLSLIYGVVGPIVDPSFAERLPYHGHVFLGPVPLFHDHPAYRPQTPSSAHNDSQGNVLFTPDGEGTQTPYGIPLLEFSALAAILVGASQLLTTLAGLAAFQNVSFPFASPESPPPKVSFTSLRPTSS